MTSVPKKSHARRNAAVAIATIVVLVIAVAGVYYYETYVNITELQLTVYAAEKGVNLPSQQTLWPQTSSSNEPISCTAGPLPKPTNAFCTITIPNGSTAQLKVYLNITSSACTYPHIYVAQGTVGVTPDTSGSSGNCNNSGTPLFLFQISSHGAGPAEAGITFNSTA
jgi:hypothetical protein